MSRLAGQLLDLLRQSRRLFQLRARLLSCFAVSAVTTQTNEPVTLTLT